MRPVPHYFDESPAVASSTTMIEVPVPGGRLELQTDHGVFSHGRLDAGTAVLLREAPDPPAAGDLLDLGCGSGPIALSLAHRAPAATVWALDVNGRARQLCAANAAANGLGNVRAVAPEDVPADVRFAAVWSNPPIRIGKPALHALLLDWLGRLSPGGTALLVVHKHLGADSLQRWLSDHGHPATRHASRSGYRLLAVAKSRSDDP